MIDQEQFLEWKRHPVTEAFMAWAQREIEALKTRWSEGAFTDQSQFATAIMNAKAIGQCEFVAKVRDLDFLELEGDRSEQSQRSEPGRPGGPDSSV